MAVELGSGKIDLAALFDVALQRIVHIVGPVLRMAGEDERCRLLQRRIVREIVIAVDAVGKSVPRQKHKKLELVAYRERGIILPELAHGYLDRKKLVRPAHRDHMRTPIRALQERGDRVRGKTYMVIFVVRDPAEIVIGLPRIGREDDAKRFGRFISDDDRNVEANFFIAFFTQMKAVETGRKISPTRSRPFFAKPALSTG